MAVFLLISVYLALNGNYKYSIASLIFLALSLAISLKSALWAPTIFLLMFLWNREKLSLKTIVILIILLLVFYIVIMYLYNSFYVREGDFRIGFSLANAIP